MHKSNIGSKYYVEPFGRTIKLMNNKPVNYSAGGMIKWEEGQYNPFTQSLEHDNKPVLLEEGSMVCPRPVIHLFHEFESKYGSVKQDKITDTNELTEVIVMPEEAIIPKRHAPQFKAFLKSHGVTLPLQKKSLFSNENKKNIY